jgi:hypothetical protein
MMTDMTATIEGFLVPAPLRLSEDFAALAQVLFGDDVDISELDAVSKSSPDSADVHVPGGSLRPTQRRAVVRDRGKRRLTAGLSAVGAGAGALGLAVGAKAVRRDGWKATPKLTRALLPAEAVGLGGELMATKILHNDTKQQPQLKAAALALPKLEHVADGLRGVWRKSLGINDGGKSVGRHGAPPVKAVNRPAKPAATGSGAHGKPTTGKRQHPESTARSVGNAAGTALSTNKRKVAAAGVVSTASLAEAHHHKIKNEGMGLDPYAYAKSLDVTWEGSFSKLDDDKHQAFGWASVVKYNGQPVTDKQGDYITPEDIEEAAYNYVLTSRVGTDMHARDVFDEPIPSSAMIESMVFTPEKISKMGLPDDFPVGWWVGYKYHDEDTWQKVKKGEYTGFSIHGKGIRKALSPDELYGYR